MNKFSGLAPVLSYIPSEMERDTELGPAEPDVLQELVAALIVCQVAVHQAHLAPVERVAHPGRDLPGELGVARADIGVIRQEPAVIECDPAFCSQDAVPETDGLGELAVSLQPTSARKLEVGIEGQEAGAGEQIQVRLTLLPDRIRTSEGPDPAREP